VALDWDGKTPIPYLAKSWTISEDGSTYTFKLRDDVQFCSGKKFTAADVIYSFKRLKDPDTKGALRLACRQHQGAAHTRSLHCRIRTKRAVRRPVAPAHHVHDSDPQPGKAWRRSARTMVSRRSTVPGHGASRAGSRARRSC